MQVAHHHVQEVDDAIRHQISNKLIQGGGNHVPFSYMKTNRTRVRTELIMPTGANQLVLRQLPGHAQTDHVQSDRSVDVLPP